MDELALREEIPPPDTELVNGATEYVVEAVEALSKESRSLEQLIKWEGTHSIQQMARG